MWASVQLDIRPVFVVNTASEHALSEQSARTVVEMGGTPLIWYVIGPNTDGKTEQSVRRWQGHVQIPAHIPTWRTGLLVASHMKCKIIMHPKLHERLSFRSSSSLILPLKSKRALFDQSPSGQDYVPFISDAKALYFI
jgi:hypothetical protein